MCCQAQFWKGIRGLFGRRRNQIVGVSVSLNTMHAEWCFTPCTSQHGPKRYSCGNVQRSVRETDMTIGAGHSLPAWLYTDARFFEAERRHLFARGWHLVCHLNDIPDGGDYHTLDILGEHFVTLRGLDGVARSFHNVCRHRASRIADGNSGNCGHRLVCPYHAWSYDLDGSLKSVPPWQGFEELDKTRHGLVPLEQEI